MVTTWRIIGLKHLDDAFSGMGAKKTGGRWNSKGVLMVYTSGSLALSALEMVVNLPSPKLLQDFRGIPLEFDKELVITLAKKDTPPDWGSRPLSPSTRAIGDLWVKEEQSAVLKVPSVVVPREHNYLINPKHPDFIKIKIGKPIVFHFDPRIKQ